MIFQRLPSSEDSDGEQFGGEAHGNFSRNHGKKYIEASLEPSEDIWMVFMAIVRDFQVN